MTTYTEDLENFNNSLSAELGISIAAALSAQEKDRPFLGAEALAAYAVYLLGIFASAFLESLKNGLESEVKAAAKMLAEELIKRVKRALTELKKPAMTSEYNRRQALSTVDDALRKAAAYPEAAAALQTAECAGQAEIAAELQALGIENAEAQKTAERLMRTIVSRMRAMP